MPVSYGDQACLEPLQLRAECERLNLPTAFWWGDPYRLCRANSWLNKLGCDSGIGYILLLRSQIDSLGLNAEHELLVSTGPTTVGGKALGNVDDYQIAHYNLHIVRAVCVTPSYRGAPDAAYFVELADRRRLAHMRPLDAQFNVLTPDGSEYTADSLAAGGVPYTWTSMLEVIWSALDWGDMPELPRTPMGTPENWYFAGATRAIDALCTVLHLLGMELQLDTSEPDFTRGLSIIDRGATMATSPTVAEQDDVAVETAEPWLINDTDPQVATLGRVAEKVRVFFPIANSDSSSYYSIDVPAPAGAAAGAEAGSVEPLASPSPAIYDAAGAVSNLSDLNAKANGLAASYYRLATYEPLDRVWTLIQPDIKPGHRASWVRQGDRGYGAITEAENDPDVGPDTVAKAATPPCPCDAPCGELGSIVSQVGGWYFGGMPHRGSNVSLAADQVDQDVIYAMPWREINGYHITHLAFWLTNSANSGKVRIGIYKSAVSEDGFLYPGALLFQSPELAASVAGNEGLRLVEYCKALPECSLLWFAFYCSQTSPGGMAIKAVDLKECWAVNGNDDAWADQTGQSGWKLSRPFTGTGLPDPFPDGAGRLDGIGVGSGVGLAPAVAFQYGHCCLDSGWYCMNTGSGCPGEAVFVDINQYCDQDYLDIKASVCSGPYATQAAAEAVCAPPAPPTPIVTNCCPGGTPASLTVKWTVPAGCTGGGTTVTFTAPYGTGSCYGSGTGYCIDYNAPAFAYSLHGYLRCSFLPAGCNNFPSGWMWNFYGSYSCASPSAGINYDVCIYMNQLLADAQACSPFHVHLGVAGDLLIQPGP